MYEILLKIHNVLRWFVLIFGILAIVKSYTGWKSGAAWTKSEKKFGTFFIASLHSQLLIGLILYFVSPMMQLAMSDMGTAMKNKELRFFAVEHALMMVIAVVIAQVGSIVARKSPIDSEKYRKQFIYFTIAMVIILLMIPFGIINVSRPLFPGM